MPEFRSKCDKLVSGSYANTRICIDKLVGQIKQKDQVINHLLVSLKNLTCKYQSKIPPATNTEAFSKNISAALQSKIKKTDIQYGKEILTDELAK